MRKLSIVIVIIFLTISLSSCQSWADKFPQCKDPFVNPVSMKVSNRKLEIEKYMGKWYEIARSSYTQQGDCVCSEATYQFNQQGVFLVENRCTRSDNGVKTFRAKALSRNPPYNTKLEVFFDFAPTIPRNYWILDIDDNYEWAVIGEPCIKSGWILSRSSVMTSSSIEERLMTFRYAGYSTKDFIFRDKSCS